MAYYRKKWKPSKSAAREFAQTMDTVQSYCDQNGIGYSSKMDSFYFTYEGQKYRISNHSVEASNQGRRNAGLEEFHGSRDEYVNIFASKTRLVEIHQRIVAGLKVNGRGFLV